ncbi:BrnT family toxin [bacterium]|nr:BrnT family toxin [bacterium]MBU1600200.1 BrnT family toxin [bacterium]MBU2462309.1 BrnT family toxin [bacterium]
MRIKGYIWRRDVVDKLKWKHYVEIEEVEEVFGNRPYIKLIEKGRLKGEDVYVAFGRTEKGRYLIVFFIYKKNHKVLINTARDMTKRERRQYEKKQ